MKFAAEALPSHSHFFFRRRREAREEVMSSRRNVRLRREYLYRKQLETNDRIVYEKKRKLKQAIESGNGARLPPAPRLARPALRLCACSVGVAAWPGSARQQAGGQSG